MRQVSQNKCDLRDQKLDALFPSTFVLVHDSVRASSRFIYGTVMAGVINRDPYSHSYLVPGRFRRCARFLLLQSISSINISKDKFQFVPLQDFSKPWTDEELYKKYGLTDEEIQFIESMIRPME